MGELDQSSVLFSLEGLMDLEATRIREEEAREGERQEAQRQARAEAARVAREAELLAFEAENDRRRAAEARRREEEGRLAAIRLAEIERAHIEAAERARSDLLRTQQTHERELAAINADASKRRYSRLAVTGAIATVVLLGTSAGIYFGKIAPEERRREAETLRMVAERDTKVAALERDIERRQKRVDDLSGELEEEERRRLELDREEHDRLRDEQSTDGGRPSRGVAPPKPRPAKRSGRCTDPNDPMCFSLD